MSAPSELSSGPVAGVNRLSDAWRRLRVEIGDSLEFIRALRQLKAREARIRAKPARATRTDAVVSLTSMPGRMERLHYCIRSLLAQTVQPQKIILNLSEHKISSEKIPSSLSDLVGERFEIRICQPVLNSYEKLIPVLGDFSSFNIITCDDDKIYPEDWLETLVSASDTDPGAIICHCGRVMPKVHIEGAFPEYREWPELKVSWKSLRVLPIGVGGVLYPPGSLHEDCDKAEIFMQLAPFADDLWLKFMSLRMNTPVWRIDRYAKHPPSIPTPWHTRLSNRNVYGAGNVSTFKALGAFYPECLELIAED